MKAKDYTCILLLTYKTSQQRISDYKARLGDCYKAQHPGAEPEQILVALYNQIREKGKTPIKNNNIKYIIDLCIKNNKFNILNKKNLEFINLFSKKEIINFENLSEIEKKEELATTKSLHFVSLEEFERVFENIDDEKRSEELRLILKDKKSAQVNHLEAKLANIKTELTNKHKEALLKQEDKYKAQLEELKAKHKDELKAKTLTKNEALQALRDNYAEKMKNYRKAKNALERQERLNAVSFGSYEASCFEMLRSQNSNHIKKLWEYMYEFYKHNEKTNRAWHQFIKYCYSTIGHREPEDCAFLLNSYYMAIGSPPKDKLAYPLVQAINAMMGAKSKWLTPQRRVSLEQISPREGAPLSFAAQDKKAKEEELARVLENTRRKYGKSNLEGEIYEIQ